MTSDDNDRFDTVVRGVADAIATGEEYMAALTKIIAGHATNELVGAQAFDEPAIALAPTPYDKWLTCRIAMEEFGHHVHFKRLATDLGIEDKIDLKKSLSIFEFEMSSFADFIAVKTLADLAEILQMEDLVVCSYQPLRDLSERLMPEERFHAGFGRSRLQQLCETPQGKKEGQASIHRFFQAVLPFFGRSQSRNNEMFRRWGIKKHTNGFMRGDFIQRAFTICDEVGIDRPDVPDEYKPDIEEFERDRNRESK